MVDFSVFDPHRHFICRRMCLKIEHKVGLIEGFSTVYASKVFVRMCCNRSNFTFNNDIYLVLGLNILQIFMRARVRGAKGVSGEKSCLCF